MRYSIWLFLVCCSLIFTYSSLWHSAKHNTLAFSSHCNHNVQLLIDTYIVQFVIFVSSIHVRDYLPIYWSCKPILLWSFCRRRGWGTMPVRYTSSNSANIYRYYGAMLICRARVELVEHTIWKSRWDWFQYWSVFQSNWIVSARYSNLIIGTKLFFYRLNYFTINWFSHSKLSI